MTFPNEGPGRGTAALDALRGLGLLNPADDGDEMMLNPHRMTDADTWGVPTGAVPPPEPPYIQALRSLQQRNSMPTGRAIPMAQERNMP